VQLISTVTLPNTLQNLTMILNAEDLSRLENPGLIHEIDTKEMIQSRHLGEQFHLVMRQSLMGLPIAEVLDSNKTLSQWFSQLKSLAPEIWTEEPNTWKAFNYCCECPFENVVLQSNFDVIIYRYEQAEIVNWTARPMPNLETITLDWRTQLDLFIIAQTDSYLPEQIRLTYWFLNEISDPIKVSLHYNSSCYGAFKSRLAQTISKLFQATKAIDTNLNDSTLQFLQGKISPKDYIDSIPEVEI
jgi:hypothetical protein